MDTFQGDASRQGKMRGGVARTLAKIAPNYDIVLIDTPPLLSTDDARTIATMAKGILLVVTRGTLARSVSEAVVAIEALQAPLMGVVANRFKESSVPYYY
jgi:Mrp family chromosome partitioning ATPase